MSPPPSPTGWQVRRARAVTRWYLTRHYGRPGDPGLPAMFFDPANVGAFAISQEAFEAGDDDALFTLLVATVMFQRRQDVQIMRVLRGMPEEVVEELTSTTRLLELADAEACDALGSLARLKQTCDLGKDPETKQGVCCYNAAYACALKRHTVSLKRYGHFGKVPTSLALALEEHGGGGLRAAIAQATAATSSPMEASRQIERVLREAWRVSDKIAAMYLSMLSNPALSPGGRAPWEGQLDHTAFVVIDSNVDLFLRAIDYPGPWTYARRREFIQALAARVPLDEYDARFERYNPRVVQQAMYLFMSESNRRAIAHDCSNEAPPPCGSCDAALRSVCPRR